MRPSVRVGELVSYTGSDGPEVAGLVVEIRRTDCRVLDLESERAIWLPQSHLRRGARQVRMGSATSLLSSLVLHLEGTEIEVERIAQGGTRALIAVPAIDADAIDEVRRFLGATLRSIRIQPGGLGKIYLAVEFAPRDATSAPVA